MLGKSKLGSFRWIHQMIYNLEPLTPGLDFFFLHKLRAFLNFQRIAGFNELICFNEGNLLRALLTISLFYNIYYINKFTHKTYFH